MKIFSNASARKRRILITSLRSCGKFVFMRPRWPEDPDVHVFGSRRLPVLREGAATRAENPTATALRKQSDDLLRSTTGSGATARFKLTNLPEAVFSLTDPAAIREAVPEDAVSCGRIMYLAFRQVHESHGFASDFPDVEAAIDLARTLIADPMTFGIVAERGNTIIGSNFLSEGDPIRGVGPITVHPDHQCEGVGRLLMEAVIARGAKAAGLRLVQDAFNTLSMALYARLGFDVREPLALLKGHVRPGLAPDLEVEVRPMREADLAASDALCQRIHCHARSSEVRTAQAGGAALVAVRDGRLTGYMTAPHFWTLNHAVAETEDDLKALIAEASRAGAPVSFLLPIRQADLFRWCLEADLMVQKPMNLMSLGHYSPPRGAFLPSVLF